ncbi:hypothetical protein SGLAM104S_06472 [Streptomyces glaucescens]
MTPDGCARTGRAWSTAAPSPPASTAAWRGSARPSSCSWTTCAGGGDVLADDLFGPDVAARWMAARSVLDADHRILLHNDGICSPTDPLSSVATAITRRCCLSGRVHGP